MYIYFFSQNFGYSMNTHASIAGSPLPAGGRKRLSGTLGADAGELVQALVGDARHGRRQGDIVGLGSMGDPRDEQPNEPERRDRAAADQQPVPADGKLASQRGQRGARRTAAMAPASSPCHDDAK